MCCTKLHTPDAHKPFSSSLHQLLGGAIFSPVFQIKASQSPAHLLENPFFCDCFVAKFSQGDVSRWAMYDTWCIPGYDPAGRSVNSSCVNVKICSPCLLFLEGDEVSSLEFSRRQKKKDSKKRKSSEIEEDKEEGESDELELPQKKRKKSKLKATMLESHDGEVKTGSGGKLFAACGVFSGAKQIDHFTLTEE